MIDTHVTSRMTIIDMLEFIDFIGTMDPMFGIKSTRCYVNHES